MIFILYIHKKAYIMQMNVPQTPATYKVVDCPPAPKRKHQRNVREIKPIKFDIYNTDVEYVLLRPKRY